MFINFKQEESGMAKKAIKRTIKPMPIRQDIQRKTALPTVVGVIFIIAALINFVVGVMLMFVFMSRGGMYNSNIILFVSMISGMFMILFGIFCLAVALGYFKRMIWAWYAGLVFSAFSIVMALIGIMAGSLKNIGALMLWTVILVLIILSRKDILKN
jgi:hypothetical protein